MKSMHLTDYEQHRERLRDDKQRRIIKQLAAALLFVSLFLMFQGCAILFKWF